MADRESIKQHVRETLGDYCSADNSDLREIISDIMEDIALGRAMEAGDKADYVDEGLVISTCISA
jgi:hypothetical protein